MPTQNQAKDKAPEQYGKFRHNISRFVAITGLILVFAIFIGIAMFRTTVLYNKEWNAKADAQLSRIDTIKPVRGDILAADGSVLATNVVVYDVRLDYRAEKFDDKKFLVCLDSLADSMAHYFPRRDKEGWKAYLKAPLSKPDSLRPRAYNLMRGVSYSNFLRLQQFPFLCQRNANRSGLTFESRTKREYPYGEMARRSIGRTSENEKTGQVHGYSGLEEALDGLLYGKPGLTKKVAITNNIVDWVDRPAQQGYTLTTTIDVNMQDIVENELENMLQSIQADWGTAILMEVGTGDIKAIANLERDTINGDGTSYVEAMNRAVQRFEPGSVIKLVGMIVALEDDFHPNLASADIKQVPLIYGGGGGPIKDTHYAPNRMLSMMQLLEYSSNIGMTRLVADHFYQDPNSYRERVRALGFFERFNTGIAGEVTPWYPTLDVKAGGRVSLSRMIYGYATQVPPLYTCALYNAVAGDGRFVKPRLVSKITSPEGVDSIVPVMYVDNANGGRLCSEKNAQTLRDMLRRVVTERSGTAWRLENDLVHLAGKTGTAIVTYELPRIKGTKAYRDSVIRAMREAGTLKTGYREGHYRLAFCGMFPYENPKYTCMVLISNPMPGVRAAQLTSGIVVKNVALKLYSRGLLDNDSNYIQNEQPDAQRPILYATRDSRRQTSILKTLGLEKAPNYPNPKAQAGVPDVRGLGLREAVVALETAGYHHRFRGEGYVVAQSCPPGTKRQRGDTIIITLRNRK